MNQEIASIEKNKNLDSTELPRDKTKIGEKWVYNTKLNGKGEIEKHKVKMVDKGFLQNFGVDYVETFAQVSRLDDIRTILPTAVQQRSKIYHLDVKSAFLNGILEEEVDVENPLGF